MNEKEKPQLPLNNDQTEAVERIRGLETLALVRTRFSSERALMAWMRTSAKLFAFGFSITKFFDYLERQQRGIQFSEGPHRLGFALICVGILALAAAVVQHVQRLRRAKELGLPTISKFSLPIGAAVSLLVIGSAMTIGIALRWLL